MGDRHQISIHALREEGDQKGHTERRRQAISIHALREEGDQKGHTERRRQAISIHALREEGDIPESYTELDGSVFLSTPSARRATYWEEMFAQILGIFLSTPSARRATTCHAAGILLLRISIHALREEGDHPGRQRWCPHCDFYPRPPRGGRPGPSTQPYPV